MFIHSSIYLSINLRCILRSIEVFGVKSICQILNCMRFKIDYNILYLQFQQEYSRYNVSKLKHHLKKTDWSLWKTSGVFECVCIKTTGTVRLSFLRNVYISARTVLIFFLSRLARFPPTIKWPLQLSVWISLTKGTNWMSL